MKSNYIISTFIYIYTVVYIMNNHIHCQNNCSRKIKVKHVESVKCEMRGPNEFAIVKCKYGYEFESGVFSKTFLMDNVIEIIQCQGKNFYLSSN